MGGKPVPVPTSEMILCIPDLEREGSKKLEKGLREFFNSGSTDQITLRANQAAYQKYFLRPRVLVDVSQCDTSIPCPFSPRDTTRRIAFPLCISPAGIQAAAHPAGELATARAAARWHLDMAISSYANYSVEAITAAGRECAAETTPNPTGDANTSASASQPPFFAIQLYSMKRRDVQARLISRAASSGCKAILLTADSPVLGVRYNEWRNDFRTPAHLAFPNLEISRETLAADTHDNVFMGFNSDAHSWGQEIKWLRERIRECGSEMQVWIKGVLTAEDVEIAKAHGVDGVVVSNHGGRQLDGVVPTLEALGECVDAARGSKVRVHVDGGVRSGSDIFKAIALGAECVWVGRPVIWGLAYGGPGGVEKMIETYYNEFRRCMQLTGCRSVRDISKRHLTRLRPEGTFARL